MKNELTYAEETRFDVLKSRIKKGLNTAFQVGLALMEIRDLKLYRVDFDSFEAFCKKEYEIERAHAYRLIEASEIKMSPIGDKIENEAQARALAHVPLEEREEVMDKVEKGGKVTAAAIKEAAAKKVIELDKEGHPIPEEILEDWRRAESFSEVIRKVSEVRVALAKGLEDQDVVFAEVKNGTLADLHAIYTALKCVVPHAVCTSCQGRNRKKCSLCKGRGFISSFAWKTFVPEEIRKMRSKK